MQGQACAGSSRGHAGAKLSPLALVPSFADLAFVMPLVFLFGRMDGARSLLGDGDTGWHVRTGEWILEHGRVPDRDLFSFTRPGQPWFAWEWLWDVVFGWIHRYAGMAGVVWASALLIGLTTALLYTLARRQSGHPLLALLATLAAAAASSIHWLARPHLFTVLFLVIFALLLEETRGGRGRLAWLPPLTLLWTNLHGGFFTGILLVAAYGAGELLEAATLRAPSARRAALARARPYFATAAACLLASLVNPYGGRLHLHIAAYLMDPFASQHILEFQTANFQPFLARYFELLLALGAAAACWSVWKRRWTDALVVAGTGHLALIAARNIPLFATLAAPVVARALAEWLALVPAAELAPRLARAADWLREAAPRWEALERVPRLRVLSLSAALWLGARLAFPGPAPAFQSSYDPKRYPERALEALPPGDGGAVFTQDEWGDYLIYRLYPRVRVFVDGRSDFYGTPFEEQYADVMQVRWGWEEHLRGYGVDTILLPPDIPLAGALKESSRWQVVYDDGVALIFRRAGSAPAAGEPFSAVARNRGAYRDREITKLEPRGVPATHKRSELP